MDERRMSYLLRLYGIHEDAFGGEVCERLYKILIPYTKQVGEELMLNSKTNSKPENEAYAALVDAAKLALGAIEQGWLFEYLDAEVAPALKKAIERVERGTQAWADVPDATQWVDDLRGNVEEPEPAAWVRNLTEPQPRCVTDLKYRSITEVVDGVQYTPLYPASSKPDLLNQTCCECGRSGGYALYCVDCWNKSESPAKTQEWVGLTMEDVFELRRAGAHGLSDTDAFMIDRKLKEKNHEPTRQSKYTCGND